MPSRFRSYCILGAISFFAPNCFAPIPQHAIAQETRTVQDWKALFPGIEVKLDAAGQLQAADFSKCQFSGKDRPADAALSLLPQQAKLRNVTIGGREITEVGLRHLANCENLGALSILDSPITDEALTSLQPLAKLKELSLVRLDIGDKCLAPFLGNKSLAKLRVRGASRVTDQAIVEYLPQFQSIVSLELSELPIGDTSLDVIARLPKLSELNLLRTRVTSVGLRKLAGLPLKKLNLDDIPTVGDDAIPAILSIPSLEFLHLGKTKITDRGVAELAALKNLKDLLINDTAVSESALASLQSKLPALRIKSK